MTRADAAVEKASHRLQDLSNRMAARGGGAAKLARPLADDAAFVRKLKPSLIKARAKGANPSDAPPEPAAPAGPQLGDRPKPGGRRKMNPLVVVGAGFALGILLAKVVEWRAHAHPRQ